MRRLWVLALAVAGLMAGSGISEGQTLNLTQTFPDALLGSFTMAYTASSGKLTVTDVGSSFTDWYTSSEVGPAISGGTFNMTVYINNSGAPFSAATLSADNLSDSCSITGTPTSGPYADTLIDYLNSTSLVADGYAGSKTAYIYEFQFAADSLGVATNPGWDFGIILTGAENETPGFSGNFTASAFTDQAGNAFDLPEPTSGILMLGSVFMFARRTRRRS